MLRREVKAMITKVEGMIVNETPYGDSSKIIQVFTKEYGIIGIMCKGVKSMKSRLRALTIKFTYGYFYIYYKEDKLSILKDVDIIDDFKRIKNDIILISYLNYLTELTSQVYKQCEDNSLYDLYISAVKKINNLMDPLVITNIIELKYLPFLGVGLELDACISCGNKTSIVTIDADIGGFVCKNCYTNQILVSSKTIKLIRMYYYVEINSISELKINEEIIKEINFFINRYYERYTGLFLNSKKFLFNMLALEQ